ncbi:hypothetical protein A33M_0903 [Rhodovulum sp. PH10]|uniref:hypothetical protein n=1 Tax=Rhodovulum sp. PH10 TaxID=1187851 RepID=UPI00027C2EBB|nr:hypothetical protein [Rhodovulum sp. PH10]EJW09808.1 hypothetical protein A33M_0903 [Rhodovulum sp. PH10]
MDRSTDEPVIVKSTPEARQGTTGHNVRYVLYFGVGLGAIAMALVYLWMFG